jgi:ArsR family transcriptional regulator
MSTARKKPAPVKARVISDDEAMQLVLHAIADPQRYRILRIIADSTAAGADISCVALLDALGFSQPTLSHHMKALRMAGLVAQRREGRAVRYQVKRHVLQLFCDQLMNELLPG